MTVAELPNADLQFYPEAFTQPEATAYFDSLLEFIAWEQRQISFFGQLVNQPRLVAWYGDPDAVYTYSNTTFEPLPWIAPLIEIKRRVETVADVTFNSVLCNLYRDGSDSMGFHSDDEPELRAVPVIASVSFGATRTLRFHHKKRSDLKYSLELTHGSLLVMQGTTQQFWKHGIPKTSKPVGPRINLTFRVVRK
ncbi:MAG TPA: alpha-ketoglutarate-dependent dioxygenase AlkB [Acidobacteriota bacterium]|nr:alpha-ketoglutarate-dependent dioxygenase AlkB [Acidobacteriota bacterium]